jgi:hypothetical protein
MLEQIADLRRYLALVEAEVLVQKGIEEKSKNMDFSKGPVKAAHNYPYPSLKQS